MILAADPHPEKKNSTPCLFDFSLHSPLEFNINFPISPTSKSHWARECQYKIPTESAGKQSKWIKTWKFRWLACSFSLHTFVHHQHLAELYNISIYISYTHTCLIFIFVRFVLLRERIIRSLLVYWLRYGVNNKQFACCWWWH